MKSNIKIFICHFLIVHFICYKQKTIVKIKTKRNAFKKDNAKVIITIIIIVFFFIDVFITFPTLGLIEKSTDQLNIDPAIGQSTELSAIMQVQRHRHRNRH